MASFISDFGGNKETGKHTGLAAIRKAVASGMTINEIRSQLSREGIQTGSKATEYLAARPASSFIAQYGGNEETFANSGMQAVTRAQASGLSLAQIREQAAAEGVSFGTSAANYLQKDRQLANITDTFKTQLEEMDRRRQQELAQMQDQFKIEGERLRKEQERRLAEQQKAAQVQMANMAQANVAGDLKLGSGRIGEGVEAFKRRLKITPSTAQGLAIATSNKLAGAINI